MQAWYEFLIQRSARHSTVFALVACVVAVVASLSTAALAHGLPSQNPREGIWRVVPAESFVGYRVRERLVFLPAPNDAVGRTSAILGSAEISDGAIAAIRISADVRTLKSDRARRDRAVAGLLRDAPTVSFELTSPIALPQARTGQVFRMRVPGTLELHGVARRVVFPVRARWTSNRLEVIGSLKVRFADYSIRRPKFGPVLSVSDHAKIEVQLSFAHV